jgi:hypothetical protein
MAKLGFQSAAVRPINDGHTAASKTRLPTTLDQTILVRDGGGGTDGGSSGRGGRQFRLIHHRRKVPPLGSARYTSSRRRLAAFMVSSDAESYDAFCRFRYQSAETRESIWSSDRRTKPWERASEKWRGFRFFRCSSCFVLVLTLVIRRYRILLIGKMSNHPSGVQWCPILTTKCHAMSVIYGRVCFQKASLRSSVCLCTIWYRGMGRVE